MGKINDINLADWKNSDVWTDSLWLIDERDKSGKHDGFYHGNFVPQVPRQLIKKYTKQDDIVLDLFLGSGTTAYEAEALGRNFIGVDIAPNMVEHVESKLDQDNKYFYELLVGDSAGDDIKNDIKRILQKHKRQSIQLAILHPPYANVIKFSDKENDLSNAKNISEFLQMFSSVIKTATNFLDKNRYLAVVIGDIYKNNEWVPLGFYCMSEAQKLGYKVKSIVIKNISNTRGKQNKEGIWKYRSLANDYYVFKHEYIIILRKE